MRRAIARGMGAFCLLVLAGQAEPLRAEGQGQGRALGRASDAPALRRAVKTDLPADATALHGQQAVDALDGPLGQKVREQGGDPARFAELLGGDTSVWIDSNGHLAFFDVAEAADGGAEPGASTAAASSVPPPLPIRLEPNGLPIHHSKPGAARTLYLDLTPQTLTVRPAWRQFLGGSRSAITTRGLSLDSDALTFTVDEQAVVSRLWGRVAEDWAPFDIDVTTERPTTFDGRVLWSIVTRSASELGFPNNSLAGIAFALTLCSPTGAFGPDMPSFTFWDVWGAANHSDIADTVSHESGHIAGLVHDGVHSFQYYGGHGTGATSWGPIMGGPIARNVTQWSRGDYPNASNFGVCGPGFQDDIAHLRSRIGDRADDVGDTIASAVPLAVPAAGIIGTTSDVDVYALPRATEIRLDVTPFRAGEQTDGGNLDVAMDIVNGAGLVVASIDDVHETAATLSATLPAGQHYLRVRASFDPDTYPLYGSLGQYTVTGTFRNVIRLTGFEAPLQVAALTAGRTVPVRFSLTDAVAGARVQLWSDASPLAATVLAESECRAQRDFRQHCTLKLPKTLAAGATYWIAAQYQDVDGSWITAQVDATSPTPNPLSVVTP